MNLENINLLSQRVDGVLSTVRNLRQEVATLKQSLVSTQAEIQDKTILLENASAELADTRAALNARTNQARAQEDTINQKQGEIDGLRSELEGANTKIADLQNLLDQTNGNLQNANDEIARLGAELNECNVKLSAIQNDCAASKANEVILKQKIDEQCQAIADKENTIAERDSVIAEKIAAIDALNAEKASLSETIQAQGEEIREAQERFKQMVSTIENELGTEIPVNVAFNEEAAAPEPAPAEQPVEEAPTPAAEQVVAEQDSAEPAPIAPEPAVEEAPVEEAPAEPEIESHIVPDTDPAEDEEDIIEVHPANEKEPDLFASNGGSQSGFFG